MACLLAPPMPFRYDDCRSTHALSRSNFTVAGRDQSALTTSRGAEEVLTSAVDGQRGTDETTESTVLAKGNHAGIKRLFIYARSTQLRQASRRVTADADITSQLKPIATFTQCFEPIDVHANRRTNEVHLILMNAINPPIAESKAYSLASKLP